MRWNWRDWVAGLAAAAGAVLVYLFAVPSGRELRADYCGLRAGMSRVEVEELLGEPVETLPQTRYYCVSLFPPGGLPPGTSREAWEEIRNRQIDELHSKVRRYPRSMYVIDVEYSGYRDPRLKCSAFRPVWGLSLLAPLLAIPLFFAMTAEASRTIRRRISSSPPKPVA